MNIHGGVLPLAGVWQWYPYCNYRSRCFIFGTQHQIYQRLVSLSFNFGINEKLIEYFSLQKWTYLTTPNINIEHATPHKKLAILNNNNNIEIDSKTKDIEIG